MASQFGICFTLVAHLPPNKPENKNPFVAFNLEPLDPSNSRRREAVKGWRIRVSDDGGSYLEMWKKAVDTDRKSIEFQRLADYSAGVPGNDGDAEREAGEDSSEELERKSFEFQKILEVSPEERDRVQRMQVIDRAAAAIAAARAFLHENPPHTNVDSSVSTENMEAANGFSGTGNQQGVSPGLLLFMMEYQCIWMILLLGCYTGID